MAKTFYLGQCVSLKITHILSQHILQFLLIHQVIQYLLFPNIRKKRIYIISDVKTDKVSILKDLGYKPNDLYQTNFLLWVEGQSDKVYLNYLIQKVG